MPSGGRLGLRVGQLNSHMLSSSKRVTVQVNVLLNVLDVHVVTIASRRVRTGWRRVCLRRRL